MDANSFGPRLCREGEDVAIVFARSPVAGRVKSRLLTHLTPEEACALHVAATRDTVELLDAVFTGSAKWIFWSEPASTAEARVDLPPSFRSAAQQGDSLGERMGDALARALASGARRVVIVGSDSPTLPAARLRQSLAAMDDHDIVLGPAEDGGYYLIGCRKFEGALFEHVEWSTWRTLAQTRRNAERLGWRIAELAPWYDLDEWKDVRRLLAESQHGEPMPRHLAAFFRQLQITKGAPL